MARPRALIVVTGSELVRGERTDRNGPFLAAQVLALGLEPMRITIVGDGPDELEAALREGLEADLCLVSGGLGPTHDDRTIELLARVAERPLELDEGLRAEIEAISRRIADRLRRPYADFETGVRKLATLPAGAEALGIAGTAPGVVLEAEGCVAVALPGPPPELQRLWAAALESEPVRRLLARARPPGRRTLRFFGASESTVAQALAEAGGDGAGVEATICAREFEIHVDLLVDEGGEERADELAASLRAGLGRYLVAEDERRIEELVLGLCRARGLSVAAAESCTGGLVAARLTSIPGASDVFLGGIVAYANEVKSESLGVETALLERHGAVSAEAAEAMAAGVRARLGADVGIAVTGVAGPGGGTPEKPGGLVFLHVEGPEGSRAVRFELPGDRESIRLRSAVAALHLTRRLLVELGSE